MNTSIVSERHMAAILQVNPTIDINRHVMLALQAGRPASAIAFEALRLMRGPGKLNGSEYFYYRLWDDELSVGQKLAFVGKKAQNQMHFACNDRHWYQTAADKILFQTIMVGAGLPVPETLAVTQPLRWFPKAKTLSDSGRLADWLCDPTIYPIFAKPAAGRYSLDVLNIEQVDRDRRHLIMLDGAAISVDQVAGKMLESNGYVVQKRLGPHFELARQFGPMVWSVRALVIVRPEGPLIHRAIVKIPTGANPADNYWRKGNMIGALDIETGRIIRVVCGTGADLQIHGSHPDTDAHFARIALPNWGVLQGLVLRAASVFPGIRTQSWDIALTENGPVFLEVNYGGDLNLAQLAEGRGVLDNAFRDHLSACGYRG